MPQMTLDRKAAKKKSVIEADYFLRNSLQFDIHLSFCGVFNRSLDYFTAASVSVVICTKPAFVF